MGSASNFVDVNNIAEDYRALKDLLAIVIVFSCLRVMKYMQVRVGATGTRVQRASLTVSRVL